MAATSGQSYSSLKNYLKYTVALCSSNHGHISSKWYVVMFAQAFKPPPPLKCGYNSVRNYVLITGSQMWLCIPEDTHFIAKMSLNTLFGEDLYISHAALS